MVAPSLLIVTFRPSEMSLSIPRGPRVVRTVSATAWQALMLLMSCALPCHTDGICGGGGGGGGGHKVSTVNKADRTRI